MPSTLTFQRIIDEVIFAAPDANPMVTWDEVQIRRYQQRIYIEQKRMISLPEHITWTNFPSPLVIKELNMRLIAKKGQQGLLIPAKAKIVIGFRKGGEQFYWHGQNKQLKKLFQDWAIPPWRRDKIPLIYINDQLAVVVGHAVSDLFYVVDSNEAWELTC